MSESGRGFNQRVILENLVSGYPSSLTHRSVQAPSAVHYRSLGGWAYSTSGFLPTHSGEGSNRTMRHLEHPAQWPTLTSTTAISFVNTLIMAIWRYRVMHSVTTILQERGIFPTYVQGKLLRNNHSMAVTTQTTEKMAAQ